MMSFFIINRKDKHTMNYEKNYFDYINYVRTLNRERNKKSLYELHHILPKSIGGKNDKNNLILLTYREHYLAHYLLWKIYKNKQMLYAFWLMSNMPKIKFKISSRLYEKLKIEFIRTTISTSSKKIVCLETGEVYNSIIEASKKYNLKDGWGITIAIKNKKRVSAGYHWDYYDETIDYTKNQFFGREKQRFSIIRLEDVKIYYGYREASIENNCAIGTLSTVITKQNMTASGYHWDYYDETIDYTKNQFFGKRKKETNGIMVICLETGEKFNTQKEAATKHNIKVSGDIKRACLNKHFTTAGYHWDYYDETIDYTKNQFFGREKQKGKKVICIETRVVFPSLKGASASLKLTASSLTEHLKGRQKTFGGFHWEEYYEN